MPSDQAADRALAHGIADILLNMSMLIRSGRVPRWCLITIGASVNMIRHLVESTQKKVKEVQETHEME